MGQGIPDSCSYIGIAQEEIRHLAKVMANYFYSCLESAASQTSPGDLRSVKSQGFRKASI
jgi:hypothetical protein